MNIGGMYTMEPWGCLQKEILVEGKSQRGGSRFRTGEEDKQ
jgi:hypothetical protein